MNGSFPTGQLSAPRVVACWAVASQPLEETILYHDEVSIIIIIICHACMKNGCSDDDDEFIFVTNLLLSVQFSERRLSVAPLFQETLENSPILTCCFCRHSEYEILTQTPFSVALM